MILTTTNTIEGFKILEYKGIVSGTSFNIQKMKMTFNKEKYYAGVAEGISEVKEKALQQIKDEAVKVNANAVVGIKVEMGLTSYNYVTVSVTGTAVAIGK